MVTLTEAAARLVPGAVTSIDLVDAALDAIARHNARTNAFIHVDAEGARAAAHEADRDRARGEDRGPLHGLPISVKDLIDVRGQVTTAASRVLHDHVATADAPVVTRLRDAGAVIIGKTNLHEFALGTTSEDSAFGAVRHPHDERRVAGGSSGGSAVAVALGMGIASVGSDTGGSIRIPAAACGVVGLKPAHGEVPTTGVVPLSTSLDHVGPLALNVTDAAILYGVLAGKPVAAGDLDRIPLDRVRFGRLTGYFESPVAPEVREAYERALERLARAGGTVEGATLDAAPAILGHYVNIVLPEAAHWHRRYLDTRGPDYSPIVRARLESGRTIAATAYLAAREFSDDLRRDVDAALEACDVLVLPTLPIVAPILGEPEVTIDPARGDRAQVRSAMLRQTQPFNMTGHPAISLPVPSAGLPVGLQLVGRWGETARLLAIAAACEKMVC